MINDDNGNGEQDPGEAGISDVTVRFIGIVGTGKDTKIIKKETSTDADGSYTFNDLPAGRYIVIEKHKRGFVPTSHVVMKIDLAKGETSMNNDFMNKPISSLIRKR
ncbi:SdrD B-like domain protein [uncultured archaeon]|nr:SdrD B-like domain protein [uncultured archaeon]